MNTIISSLPRMLQAIGLATQGSQSRFFLLTSIVLLGEKPLQRDLSAESEGNGENNFACDGGCRMTIENWVIQQIEKGLRGKCFEAGRRVTIHPTSGGEYLIAFYELGSVGVGVRPDQVEDLAKAFRL